MRLERLSLRALITISLLALVVVSAAHTMAAKLAFREAAINYRINSLERVIEVAAREVTRQMRVTALDFCHGVQTEMAAALEQRLRDASSTRLAAALDDPFIKGFVGASSLDLVKLRVYDPDMRLIAQSSQGLQQLPPQLPDFLQTQAQHRTGTARFKALGGLWLSPHGPLYSILVPIGGFQIRGYLEAIVVPELNLFKVGEMIQMPFRILTADGAEVKQPDAAAVDVPPDYFAVEYIVRSESGEPALRLVAYEDPQTLYSDMHDKQIRITAGFLGATALGLVLLLWLLNTLLFRPIQAMIAQMENCTAGDFDITLNERGTKEVHRATRAFNTLVGKVRETLRELQLLSSMDGLTGIANRRHFDAMLEREWQRALRNGTPIALLLIDIDHFKQYNDSSGHQAGDHCLKQVAHALDEAVRRRPTDLVARYGGEEFVALLPETDAVGAGAVAQRIEEHMTRLNIPHPASPVASRVTLSIGVCAVQVAPGKDSGTLISAADSALYRAKRHGRNRTEFAGADDLAATSKAVNQNGMAQQ